MVEPVRFEAQMKKERRTPDASSALRTSSSDLFGTTRSRTSSGSLALVRALMRASG
jgi:hypothetical protein